MRWGPVRTDMRCAKAWRSARRAAPRSIQRQQRTPTATAVHRHRRLGDGAEGVVHGDEVAPVRKALEDRGWIEVIGHKDTPGRPALYATTKSFLNDLSLRSLSELPPLAELDAHPALELPEVPQEPVYPEQGRIDDVNESDDLLAPVAPDTPPALPESADAALFEISDGDAMTQPASPTVH